MFKDDQKAVLMAMIIFVFVTFTFNLIGAFGKAWHAFYHQVIVGDEVAGQVNRK